MEKLTKLSFGFTDDDKAMLESLKGDLRGTNGVLSNVAVIRIALRALKRKYEPSYPTRTDASADA
jgi:hypothetical protein